MARAARPWFRFYVEALSDRKLRRMDPAVRWVLVGVFGLARMSPTPGFLLVAEGIPADENDIAYVAGVPVALVRKAMPQFVTAHIVERVDGVWHVINFTSRQFESDDVTSRTRKHRSKERSNSVRGNAPETETEAETDTTPQPPAERGADHRGQHPNCRQCGTTRRPARPEPIAAPKPRQITEVLAERPPPDVELNLAQVADARRHLQPVPPSPTEPAA